MSLNTTPRTWVAGEVVTAAEMNTEIRDALTGIQAAWSTYTPTWTAVTTNPVLGNGILAGRDLQVGKTIQFSIKLTDGSTTTYGSGGWKFTVPVAPNVLGYTHFAGAILDVSSGAPYSFTTYSLSGSTVTCLVDVSTAGGALQFLTGAAPMAFAVSDTTELYGCYEAA